MQDDKRRAGWVLVLACLAVFVVILDATIVAVALADIRVQLGMDEAELAWVVNAYTLTFAGFLLFGGRCADVFGHRATLLAGIGLFTGASLVAGLAGAPAVLLAARAVQGLGGALLLPTTLAVLAVAYPSGQARTKALAAWSMVGACGGTVGTVLGGILTASAGWRWVFLVNLPIGLVVAVLGVLVLTARDATHARPRLDSVGAVLATAGLTAVVFAVMSAGGRGLGDPLVLGSVVAGVLLLAVFGVHQQWWSSQPLMPPGFLRLRTVASGNAVMFLIGLGFFASPVLLSLYLQTVRGEDPFTAGLAFVPGGLGLIIGGRLAARSTGVFGPRRAAVGGLLIAAAGFGGLGVLLTSAAPSVVLVELSVALFGFGIGASFTPITVVATAGVPPERSGLAAGLLNTVRQASGALGLAVLSVVATTSAGAGGSYAAAYGVAAGFALAAVVLAALALPRRVPGAAPEAAVAGSGAGA